MAILPQGSWLDTVLTSCGSKHVYSTRIGGENHEARGRSALAVGREPTETSGKGRFLRPL